MEDYQVSLNGLLDRCQEIFSVDIKKRLLFFSELCHFSKL